MLNKGVAAGTSPTNIFVCGLSQGGEALKYASIICGFKIVSIGLWFSFPCCTDQIAVFDSLSAGALAIASVLLYPKTLGGCVVFSGSVPLSKSFAERVPPEARKVLLNS
jgi:lysophospholipase-2